MFGINKVTGRGRQTIEALKNGQGNVVNSFSSVLNNQRMDVVDFSVGDTGAAKHTHTFKLGNSTAAFISVFCPEFQYGYSLTIRMGDYILCQYESGGESVNFGMGVMINNGFIHPLPFNDNYISISDPFEAVKKFVSVPILEGEAKIGNITVDVRFSGDPSDNTVFTSRIKVNFN